MDLKSIWDPINGDVPDELANTPPINLLGIAFFDVFGEEPVFVQLEVRVFVQDGFGLVAGQLEDLLILTQVGDFQVERNATLLGAFNVAGSP